LQKESSHHDNQPNPNHPSPHGEPSRPTYSLIIKVCAYGKARFAAQQCAACALTTVGTAILPGNMDKLQIDNPNWAS